MFVSGEVHVDRTDVIFLSHGTRCAAWLYRPGSQRGPHPCVVLAHGLGATRDWHLLPDKSAVSQLS
jgi:cephalosporin-C deacetylase-like acetyl esterase